MRPKQHTVSLFFYLEGDRLPSHLQEVDGLAQRLPFQTDPVDGQHSVSYMDGSGPAEETEIQDSTTHGPGNGQSASALTGTETKRLLVLEKDETDIVYCLV